MILLRTIYHPAGRVAWACSLLRNKHYTQAQACAYNDHRGSALFHTVRLYSGYCSDPTRIKGMAETPQYCESTAEVICTARSSVIAAEPKKKLICELEIFPFGLTETPIKHAN